VPPAQSPTQSCICTVKAHCPRCEACARASLSDSSSDTGPALPGLQVACSNQCLLHIIMIATNQDEPELLLSAGGLAAGAPLPGVGGARSGAVRPQVGDARRRRRSRPSGARRRVAGHQVRRCRAAALDLPVLLNMGVLALVAATFLAAVFNNEPYLAAT
jgi:hypothetical protein